MSSKRLIIFGLLLMAIALIWSFMVFPFLIKIPSDYNITYEFKGVNHVLNPQSLVMEETSVSMERVQTATGTDGNVVLIKQDIIYRDASSGVELPFGSTEVFGVDRSSREHVEDYGDRDREGQFSFPLDTKRKTYPFWVSSAGQALDAEFISKEVYEDLLVYNYKVSKQRIPIGVNPASGLMQEIDVIYDIKVEPISGIPVFVSTTSTVKMVQSSNVKTPSFISSIRYTDATTEQMLKKAKDVSNFVLWSKTYGFWLAIGVGGALFLLGLIKEGAPAD